MDNSIIKATETITTSTAPAMPDEASPRPWRVEKSPANSNFWVVRCDNGVSVATAWHEADAALIVEAVNAIDATLKLKRTLLGWSMEIDRLRDIVRRLADTLQSIIDAAEGRGVGRLDEGLVREAREALGEDKP